MPAAFTVEFEMYVPRATDADDDIRLHWAGLINSPSAYRENVWLPISALQREAA